MKRLILSSLIAGLVLGVGLVAKPASASEAPLVWAFGSARLSDGSHFSINAILANSVVRGTASVTEVDDPGTVSGQVQCLHFVTGIYSIAIFKVTRSTVANVAVGSYYELHWNTVATEYGPNFYWTSSDGVCATYAFLVKVDGLNTSWHIVQYPHRA